MHVLVAGESWITQSTHIKGVDHFTVSSYVEGIGPLRDALEGGGHTVEHLPAHPAFCEQGDGYSPLWQALLGWTAGGDGS